jgi:hypothetical protein
MADATIEAIQAINGSLVVDDVTLRAPLVLPASLAPNMLPCALTFVGPVYGGKFGTTTYTTLVILAIVASGINPEPIFAQGNAFLKAMRDAYRPLGTVNGFAIDKSSHPTLSGGFGSPHGMLNLVKYAGFESYGFEWSTPLVEQS